MPPSQVYLHRAEDAHVGTLRARMGWSGATSSRPSTDAPVKLGHAHRIVERSRKTSRSLAFTGMTQPRRSAPRGTAAKLQIGLKLPPDLGST